MNAHEVLAEALNAAVASGQVPACLLPLNAPLWLSDSHEERAQAAEYCHGCPVLDACAEAGREEKFGTWGGRDVTVRPGKKLPPESSETQMGRP